MDVGNQPPIRRLYRRRRGQMLGGLAAGLAQYLQVDVSLVRLIWIVLTFITAGAAALAYLIAWVVVPEEPAGSPEPMDDQGESGPKAGVAAEDEEPTPERSGGRGRELLGWGLLAVGVWALLQRFWNWNLLAWRFFWPVVLIVIGVGLLAFPRRSGNAR